MTGNEQFKSVLVSSYLLNHIVIPIPNFACFKCPYAVVSNKSFAPSTTAYIYSARMHEFLNLLTVPVKGLYPVRIVF